MTRVQAGIFEVRFNNMQDPWVLETEIIYEPIPMVSSWMMQPFEWSRNPGDYLKNAMKAMRLMAKNLAETQENLRKQDEIDAAEAARNWQKPTNGYRSSFRAVSVSTVELVHGNMVDPNKRKPGEIAFADIPPMEVTFKNKSGILKSATVKTMKDHNWDNSYVSWSSKSPDLDPGTKLILESLEKVAKVINDHYKDIAQDLNTHTKAIDAKVEEVKAIKAEIKKGFLSDSNVHQKIPGPPMNHAKEIGDALKKAIQEGGPTIMPRSQKVKFEIPNPSPEFVDAITESQQGLLIDAIGDPNWLPDAEELRWNPYVLYAKPDEVTGETIRRIAKLDETSTRTVMRGMGGHHELHIQGYVDEYNSQVIPDPGVQVGGSNRSKNAKDPRFWAHAVEDKVNGLLQQVKQNLPEEDPTRRVIIAISDLLSDHIHGLGSEEEQDPII